MLDATEQIIAKFSLRTKNVHSRAHTFPLHQSALRDVFVCVWHCERHFQSDLCLINGLPSKSHNAMKVNNSAGRTE